MTRRREAAIGITIIAGAVVFFLLYTAIRDIRWWGGGLRVHALVEEAGRVTPGVPVLLKGVDVGQVVARRLLPDLRVFLTLDLEPSAPIPADSRVRLGSKSIFGEPEVELLPGSSPRRVQSGDTLPGIVKLSPTDLVTDLGEEARNLLSPEFVDELHGVAAEFRKAAEALHGVLRTNAPLVETMVERLNRSAAGLEQVAAGPDLQAAAQSLAATSESLRTLAEGLSGSAQRLESILAKVDRGEGSLGQFVNDPGLYEDLRALAGSYRALAEDIRRNPGRYLKVSVF
ncbi:MAG: MCE family protein [Gemmatimonadetes bacterium]|nr:MCE family protein [Gemmatimonadota bacterium]